MKTFDEMALEQACRDGDLEYIKKHVAKGKNLETKDRWEYTPLISACVQGHEQIAEYLVGIGANIEARGCVGMTPVMYASFFGYDGIVRLLVENGADIVAQDIHKSTALSLAISNKHPSTAFFLISTILSRHDLHYEDASIFAFIPHRESIPEKDHDRIIKNLVPVYLNRSLEDPAFGLAMQRDIEEILGGKKRVSGDTLSKKETGVLKKLLKTLRSIDYTDRVGQESDEEVSPAYDDMEL